MLDDGSNEDYPNERQHADSFIDGRLTAADMRRLEHACAAALVVHPLRLDIDVARVTEMDATAIAVLACLDARGAVIRPRLKPRQGTPAGES